MGRIASLQLSLLVKLVDGLMLQVPKSFVQFGFVVVVVNSSWCSGAYDCFGTHCCVCIHPYINWLIKLTIEGGILTLYVSIRNTRNCKVVKL